MNFRPGWAVLALCVVLGAPMTRADEPGPMPSTYHARTKKKKAPKQPKVTDACTSDDDCAFTTVADGQCCPTLCQPRVVSKTSAEALEKWAATCAKPEGGCPVVDCAPPRVERKPACVNRKCAARAESPRTRE